MSNGFEMCDNHTYLFATASKDCPYCEINRLKVGLTGAKTTNPAIRSERDQAVAQLRAELAEARQEAFSLVAKWLATISPVVHEEYLAEFKTELGRG